MRSLVVVSLLAVASSVAAQKTVPVVRGTVRDASTKAGVSGAVVQIVNAIQSGTARTDDGGAFRFIDVLPGTYRVNVRRIGYLPYRGTIEVGQDTVFSFNITPSAQRLAPVNVGANGAGIFGIVASSVDLKPLPEADVSIGGLHVTVQTDTAGAFFVPVKVAGTYMVKISRSWFADEMFPIDVKANTVADASTLLDPTTKREPAASAGLWRDMDERLVWRGINSAFVTGADVRQAGNNLVDALQASPGVLLRGLKFNTTVCIFVDGVPKPGWTPDMIATEDVKAVEVYATDKEVLGFMYHEWPQGAKCAPTNRQNSVASSSAYIKYLVIWTRK